MKVYRHLPDVADIPTALAIGNFDGVHNGHQAVLRRLDDLARARGLVSSILTFEPHPREFFNPDQAPARLTSLGEKVELFEAQGIDRVFVCGFDAAFAAISADDFVSHVLVKSLNARLVLVGEDFRYGAKRAGGVADMRAAGLTVETLQNVMVEDGRVSSTSVREALFRGDLIRAKWLLGRDYSISGPVVHGDQLGRKLGYPTANVEMQQDKPPLTGVYAVKLSGLDKTDLPGVASLGFRPTMKQDGKPTLEVHLLDFDGDIYGCQVRVKFLKKIRDEQKFPDLDALKQQIAQDESAARTYFLNTQK